MNNCIKSIWSFGAALTHKFGQIKAVTSGISKSIDIVEFSIYQGTKGGINTKLVNIGLYYNLKYVFNVLLGLFFFLEGNIIKYKQTLNYVKEKCIRVGK